MDRLFRIDFYPQDWLVKTGGLTPEQCGVYIQVVSLIYASRGPVEFDPARISRLVQGCTVRRAKRVLDELIALKKLHVFEGFLSNNRCEIELKVKKNQLESNRKGGENSAKKRWGANENRGIVVSHLESDLITPSPSPSPSPSPKEYFFEGKIIKLTEKDFNQWRSSYPNIRDLRATLQRLDDGAARKWGKGWWHPCSSTLAKINAEEKTTARAPLHPGAITI
jgi:uncharacterized protein YdaU (DUF1376 family)